MEMKYIAKPLWLAAGLVFGACQQSDYFPVEQVPETPAAPVEVTFTVTTPAPTAVDTRAAGEDTEIRNIDLLLFNASGAQQSGVPAGGLMSRVKVDQIEDTADPTRKKFTVRVPAVAHPVSIHVLANARDAGGVDRVNFADIAPGMLESAVMGNSGPTSNRILRINSLPIAFGEADFLPLVMAGWVRTPSISNGGNGGISTPINLLRCAAVIEVSEATTTETNGLDKFRILSATLANAAPYGWVSTGSLGTAVTPTAPCIPSSGFSGSLYVDYSPDGTFGYVATGETPRLYAYEHESKAEDYVEVIVHAEWNGVRGFYKLMLTPTGNPDNVLPIIRNHRYRMKITAASGPGYPTFQEAVNASQANNIRTMTFEDSHDKIHFLYADGLYFLSAENNTLEVRGTPRMGHQSISWFYSSRDLWIELDPALEGMRPYFVWAFEADLKELRYDTSASTFAGGEGDITITDGLLRHKIHVRWQPGGTVSFQPGRDLTIND